MSAVDVVAGPHRRREIAVLPVARPVPASIAPFPYGPEPVLSCELKDFRLAGLRIVAIHVGCGAICNRRNRDARVLIPAGQQRTERSQPCTGPLEHLSLAGRAIEAK